MKFIFVLLLTTLSFAQPKALFSRRAGATRSAVAPRAASREAAKDCSPRRKPSET